MSLFGSAVERAVCARLETITDGRLVLRHGGGTTVFGASGELGASVTVRSPRFFTAVAQHTDAATPAVAVNRTLVRGDAARPPGGRRIVRARRVGQR